MTARAPVSAGASVSILVTSVPVRYDVGFTSTPFFFK
jgi:hypothetical protein